MARYSTESAGRRASPRCCGLPSACPLARGTARGRPVAGRLTPTSRGTPPATGIEIHLHAPRRRLLDVRSWNL